MKHVVRDDADLRAGDGEADRLGADRDQDFFGAIFALVCDNGVGSGNSGGRGEDFHAGLFQVVLIGAVEPGDFAVFVFTQDRPFHRAGLGGGPAEGGRVGGGFGKVGGVDEKFFRHAAEVDAGSAEVLVFGEDDAGAGFGGEPPGAHAAAAAADDEEVAGLHFFFTGLEGEKSEAKLYQRRGAMSFCPPSAGMATARPMAARVSAWARRAAAGMESPRAIRAARVAAKKQPVP